MKTKQATMGCIQLREDYALNKTCNYSLDNSLCKLRNEPKNKGNGYRSKKDIILKKIVCPSPTYSLLLSYSPPLYSIISSLYFD